MKKLNYILAILVTFFASAFMSEAFAAGVSLSALPSSNTVQVGQNAAYTIKINRDNYTDKVTLSATNLPSGASASFNPNTTTANSSLLTITTQTTTPVGTFNISVKGTANGITIAPITVKLITTAAQNISISVLPETQSIIAGQKTFYDVTINRTGFSGAVTLSAENVPSGISVVFEPQTTTGNTARAWVYSDGFGNLPANLQMNLVAARNEFPNLRAVRLVRLNINCDLLWTDQGYAVNQMNPDFATAVTSDANGNVYLAGHITQLPNFTTNLWLAKYSPTGVLLWIDNLTVSGVAGLEKKIKAIRVDSANNVYVAGYTRMDAPVVNYDIFVVKYNRREGMMPPQQPTQISTTFGFGFSSDNAEDGTGGMEMSIDSMGRAVLTTATNIRKNSRLADNGQTYIEGFHDISRITLNSNLGIVSGSSPIVRDVIGVPLDLSVALDGSIAVVGEDLDRNALQYFGWVAKFTAGGSQSFRRSYPVNRTATRVAADSNGNVFVAGSLANDALIEKFNTQGNSQWMFSHATASEDKIGDLTIDASGNVIYAGTTKGNLAAANPDTNTDIWIAKRNTNGSLFFVRQFAVTNKDEAEAVALDNAGNLLLAGNTVDFKNINFGYEDAFVMKYSLNNSSIFTPFITQFSAAGVSTTSVRGGTQFTIEGGNFFGIQAVYFDGQPINFTLTSSSRITATAPPVSSSRTGTITISVDCFQTNSPTRLTATP
ncbi:MAG TPA: IPT/TIG domain-containing protein [Pyrinomonadaceae bacterium]|nr:IPT/TIG domain-containing protein [Pyrinomonadaceae bacterium]